jgi:hypothetical protein
MTWDILKTREKVPKKSPHLRSREKVPKKISAPRIVDPISKKILSATLFLAHQAQKLQQRMRGREGHIVHPKKNPFMAAQHFKRCSDAVADAEALAPCCRRQRHNVCGAFNSTARQHQRSSTSASTSASASLCQRQRQCQRQPMSVSVPAPSSAPALSSAPAPAPSSAPVPAHPPAT